MIKKWLLGILLLAMVIPFPVQARPQKAVDAPTLLAPENGEEITYVSHPPLAIPNFSWEAVPNATQYELQISTNISFSANVKTVATPNTRYTPDKSLISSYLVDGEFYWRVRVKSPAVSPWSEERSFIKRWAFPSAEAPNQPALVAPAASETLQFFDQPSFTWETVPGAAKYKLEIDDEETFTTLIYSQDNIPTTSHQPLTKLANGLYYWRVIPFDIAGVRGAESEIRSFTMAYGIALADRPQQLAPANGSEPLFTPTFEWTALAGAQYYQLQYSTDETFQSGVTTVDTRSTTHSIAQVANDVNIYWRVRARSNATYTEWSTTWVFQKHWYIQPQLLTPTNGYRHITESPLFSWTPVPGAGYYKLTVACDAGFTSNKREVSVLRPTYIMYDWTGITSCSRWFWKVTPYHNNGPAGKESDTWNFDYQATYADPAPQLSFPSHYYDPHLYVAMYGTEAQFDSYSMPVASLPVFGWTMSRVAADRLAEKYRVEVDDDPLFLSPNWVSVTSNAVAAPDWSNPFTPTVGVSYYWRVRALRADGTPYASSSTTGWSQRWLVRFDASLGLTPRTETTPLLLRPTHGEQGVEIMPVLEWWPVAGATRYEVQMARNATFTRNLVTYWAQYPAYTHPQASNYGTYYWRVRAWNASGALGAWSPTQRFQLAAQDRWRATHTVPMISTTYTRTLVAQSPIHGAPGDLANLYVANDLYNWVTGFDVISSTQPIRYVVLFDANQSDGSGAASDPVFGKSIVTAHRPEYAITLRQGDGASATGHFTYDQALFYTYNSVTQQWNAPQPLNTIGQFNFTAADAYSNVMPLDGFLQLSVGIATLGAPGSLSVAVYTANDSGTLIDTLPTDDGGELDSFVTIAEVPMLMTPPTNISGDPTTYPTLPILRWHPQVDTYEYRYNLQIARDPAFSSLAHSRTGIVTSAYLVPDNDLDGDNTYFWRLQLAHRQGGVNSASQYNPIPWRFERKGWLVPNLQVSTRASSVTFKWGKLEGTGRFRLERSTDPGFSSATGVDVYNWEYTVPTLFSAGNYYWRIRAVNWNGDVNTWTIGQPFTVTLPTPAGLQALPAGVSPRTPTLKWDPLILPASTPRYAAYTYRVQICENDAMTLNCLAVTTEQRSWTPPDCFNDGPLFWRVYMIDGSNNAGPWTAVQSLTKQYPATTLLAPVQGALVKETPTFSWSIVPTMPQYRIEIADNPYYSPVAVSADTAATQYTPIKTLTPKLYYWRVCARDRENKSGPCTGATLYVDPKPYRILLPLTLRNKS